MSVALATPVQLWRIGVDTPGYQAHELSGKGAELSGGRWNRPGTPLVYTSTTRALACLETVVHLGAGSLPLNRYLVAIELHPALWDAAAQLDPASLVGWDAEPAGQASLAWGEAWVRSNRSLLALVPSVIVPEEHNVLINPRHPDAGQLQALKQRRWLYDARLLR